MHPKAKDVVAIDPKLLVDNDETAATKAKVMTPADKIENSPIVSILIGVMGFIYIFYYLVKKMDLN